MTFKNICTKKTYEKDGQQKVIWLNVGTLRINDDGKQFLELNMFPNQTFFVFDKRDKNEVKEEQPNDQGDVQW